MTAITTINAALSDFVKAMLAKGFRQPEANFTIQADQTAYVFVGWVKAGYSYRTYTGDTESFSGDTFDECYAAAFAWLCDQPTVEQRQMREFAEIVAKAVEIGKQNGIDAVLVNPLEAAMKKLSRNAIVSKADAIERADREREAEHA